MSKEIQIFENEEFGQVRTLVIDGEPYFVGKDVAKILGYTTLQRMYDHVKKEDKKKIDPQSPDFTGLCENGTTLESNPNVRTYYAFSGSDIEFLINEEFYGEIEKLDFDSTRKGKELELTLLVMTSDTEKLSVHDIEDAVVTQLICDIDGHCYARKFKDVNYVGEKFTHKIDDISLKVTYIFSCGNFTKFEKSDIHEYRK